VCKKSIAVPHIQMHAIYILNSAFLLLIACNSNRQKTAPPCFELEIPVEKKNAEYDYNYKYVTEQAAEMGLDSLELGYDSLQVRIWLAHSMAVTCHVVILKLRENKWKAQLVTYEDNDDMNPKDPAGNWEKIRPVTPRSGWKDFLKYLRESNIINLPHSAEMAECDLHGHTDGIDYIIEIATNKKYRFYYYCNPEDEHGCSLGKSIYQFANLLEKEFNFTYTK
jgi:hypothetical protein